MSWLGGLGSKSKEHGSASLKPKTHNIKEERGVLRRLEQRVRVMRVSWQFSFDGIFFFPGIVVAAGGRTWRALLWRTIVATATTP